MAFPPVTAEAGQAVNNPGLSQEEFTGMAQSVPP